MFYRNVFFVICCLTWWLPRVQAQEFSIQGQLVDSQNQPLVAADVELLNPADSTFIQGVTTDLTGRFVIASVKKGRYMLGFTYVGFDPLFKFEKVEKANLDLGKLTLTTASVGLSQVNVTGKMVTVQQNGDTTQINANAFKTNPDANAEDLVTKMPGITVQDGKIQAQGEDVQKVLVDGKEFFGDDASTVLKNLPAEVVDKVQIFDKRSDQSNLTGFDDGNASKTLNIVTKPQFRNGTFGRAFAGYGYQGRWKTGFNLNLFQDKRRLSILGASNNVNEQNFSTEDLLGVMSSSGNSGGRSGGRSGGGRSGRSGGGGRTEASPADNYLVGQKNGIATTHAFGLNYMDKIGNVDFSGSYFFNYAVNNTVNSVFRQYVSLKSSGLVYNEDNQTTSENTNHRLALKIDWKINQRNSLLIQPRASIQDNLNSANLEGQNRLIGVLINALSNTTSSNLQGANVSVPMLYRHSFLKRGRTFSVNLTPGFNQNKGQNTLYSLRSQQNILNPDTVNQLGNRNAQGYTLATSVAYTEPLPEKSLVMLTYASNYNLSQSDRRTNDYSADYQDYTRPNSALSNVFDNTYMSQSLGFDYKLQSEKWNASVGLNYQVATLNSNQTFPTEAYVNKTFNNILPNAQFFYRFSQRRNLRVFYRSRTNAPNVSQLQNVINNSNVLQLSTGNPDLKQDWNNSLVLRYNSSNSEKSTSFFAMLAGNVVQNSLVQSTFIATLDTLIAPGIVLAQGAQLSKPTNLNGAFSLRTFSNYSLPIKLLKSNFNINAGGNYMRTPALVNNQLNYSASSNFSLGVVLSSNISKKIDFMVSSNTNFSTISNTLQTSLNSSYYNQNSRLKVQAMPWKGLVLQTDLSHQFNWGLSSLYNQNFLLWNIGIGYKFLEKKQAEIRFYVYDVLKQNNNINRNTAETYYEDVQTNVLQRYFLLSFTYNLKRFK